MRIISGKLKGRKLIQSRDKKTRPLKDLTKESIFNLIKHSKKFDLELKNSIVLDIFSGTGSFGIECISRGSKKVYFIENYKNTIQLLKKNIEKMNVKSNCNIFTENFFEISFYKFNKEKFNIIFIDPPYKEQYINKILDQIYDEKLLLKNGIVIIHRHIKSDDLITKKFSILETRKYGVSKIIFLKLS
tara:strand:- start:37 stop:600 length:564 start_codon:yes stop_codon:yes gene_type:complete